MPEFIEFQLAVNNNDAASEIESIPEDQVSQ